MNGYYELKVGKDGKFRFTLKAGNHQVVLASQGYADKRTALAGIASVQKNGLEDARFERKESAKQEPYFVLKATNGQIIGQSEMYSSVAACENGVKSVMANCASEVIKEIAAEA